MKKLLAMILSMICLLVSVCFVGCDKTGPLPNGNYRFTGASGTFEYIDGDVKDIYGWIIDGDTAEQWVSGVCEYKAKIVEKDGEIIFDGYKWRNWLDALLGDKDKQGSNHDYTVSYDAEKKSITLTPKQPEPIEYVFDGITFEKSDQLTIEDLSSFIPFMQAEKVKTVKDFENLILNHLDTYRLDTFENGERKEVYFTPKYHSITVKKGDIFVLTEQEGGISREVSCTPISNGERWEFMTEEVDFRWDGASTLSYTIDFPMQLPVYFRVVYNYKAK